MSFRNDARRLLSAYQKLDRSAFVLLRKIGDFQTKQGDVDRCWKEWELDLKQLELEISKMWTDLRRLGGSDLQKYSDTSSAVRALRSVAVAVRQRRLLAGLLRSATRR